jgi:hypothetical protein
MWRCTYACELATLCTPITLNHMPIPSVSMPRRYCNVFACVTDLKLTTRFTFLFSFSSHVSSNDTKSMCLSKPQLQWWIQIWESKYATEHNENKSSLPRIRVIKCDNWGSKGNDYKNSCYLVRDVVPFGTYLPVLWGKLCPASSASLTRVEVTDMWKRSKGREIANGKGTVSHSPARCPGSPALYEYLCFTVWILFYHEKGGIEFLRNANIYLPNYTTSPPSQDNISQEWKKWYPTGRHILCQIGSS